VEVIVSTAPTLSSPHGDQLYDHFRQPFRPARLLSAAVALAAATTIPACGSTSPTASSSAAGASPPTRSSSSTGSGSNSTSSTLAFSNCMRANGVPNFPDLGTNGMRIQGNGQAISVNGVSLNAPAYQTARAKCQRYLPTQAAASPSQQAQQRARGLKFASCMRSHGVPNFPDPKSYNGSQQVYLPGINPSAPAFQTAAKACGGGPKGP
jgi:hypothetical protein